MHSCSPTPASVSSGRSRKATFRSLKRRQRSHESPVSLTAELHFPMIEFSNFLGERTLLSCRERSGIVSSACGRGCAHADLRKALLPPTVGFIFRVKCESCSNPPSRLDQPYILTF